MLRDLLNASFNSVVVNEAGMYEELKTLIRTIAPDKTDILRLHKHKTPLFEHYGIDKQIRGSFGKKVNFRNGAYLIIEHTEAMHVIDVNSGHRVSNPSGQEANALDVNLEAATEIARQLRMRDMGGIIVIDFIDMHEAVNRRKLFERIKSVMATDRAKHTILPPSKFGLVQITRQRVRPELNIQMLERCPVCDGSGEIKASITLIDELENHIRYLIQEQNEPSLKLAVHPIVYSYLKKGLMSHRVKWYFNFRKWIKLSKNTTYHFLEYHFFNAKGDEIKV
jgi:ribonuclease G